MLSRKCLLFFVIAGFVHGSRQESIYATDQEKWFDIRIPVLKTFVILHDAEIENDLPITPEQRKALDDLDQQHRPRLMKAARPAKDEASKSKEEKTTIHETRIKDVSAIDQEFRLQIWKTLTTAQRERVNQILWQLDVASALSEATKVTSQIQLDAEQTAALRDVISQYERERKENMKQLFPREAFQERAEAAEAKRDDLALKILTESQRFEWTKLMGAPLDVDALRSRTALGQFRSGKDGAKRTPRRD